MLNVHPVSSLVIVVTPSYKPFVHKHAYTLTHTRIHIYVYTQGCSAHFSSLMGYQYHQQRCGREFSDDEKPVFLCQHCGKSYRSKAGRDYHIRTEHPPTITTVMTATNANNYKNSITDTNNNTGKERVSGYLRGLMKYCRSIKNFSQMSSVFDFPGDL